ncbi:MAG: phage portal protein [Holosporales bacterium]|nr:phage portal protein [Holosporales bacterium]
MSRLKKEGNSEATMLNITSSIDAIKRAIHTSGTFRNFATSATSGTFHKFTKNATPGTKSVPPQRASQSKPSAKTLQENHFAACKIIGKPTWTPRNYEALASSGYSQNVIVFRCVSLIAKSLSNVHWLLYEKRDGREFEVDSHELLALLNSPNATQSRSAFIDNVFSQLLLSGNVFIHMTQGPIGLRVLRSDRVSVLVDSDGQQTGFEYKVGTARYVFPVDVASGESEVLHIKTFHPLNDWYGMSPVEAAARAIDQHNAVGEHNLSILQNGGRPSGALLVKPTANGHTLTHEQRDALRQDLAALYEGTGNAGRIMVLEGNCDWKEMGLSPKDLDFSTGKNTSAREISQAFGVPPILVGITEDATFSNYKEARLSFWEDTLVPMLDHFVAELNRWLAPRFSANLRIGYDSDAIVALSAKRDYIWTAVQAASFLTINEKRAALGYGPIDGGDVRE